ncbi:MAG: FtsX-like permease family protein [Planctomycetota bacterium]
MRFSSLVLKNLLRRPLRSGLTLLALTTAVASVVSLRGIARGFTASFAGVYESHSVDIVVSRQGTADRLSSSVSEGLIQPLREIAGVAKVDGVLLETLSLEDQQIFGIPTMGIARDSWLREDYRWSASNATTSPRQVSLGVHLAERAGVAVGDSLEFFEEPYEVAGIFESSSAWENGSMMMPLEQLQALVDRGDQVTYINVVLGSGVDADQANEIIEQIQAVDGRLHALATDDFVGTDTRMQIAGAMAWMTSLIALVIGGIGTLNTMMTSVLERTREIGILRAIGWPQKRVFKLIVAEALLLAITASALGCFFAVAATAMMSQHPAIRGILAPEIEISTAAEGTVLAVLIGLIGAILPASRAARVSPTEAIRG